jgi:cytidine deaminase
MTTEASPPLPQDLFSAAVAARTHAYAPYSRFSVGAAVRTESGHIFAGANMENAAYPQGQCAEANALGAMVSAVGGQQIVEIVVVGGHSGEPDVLCTPCGGCRQKLREFAADSTPIYVCGPEGLRRTVTLGELLPLSFGPDNLRETPATPQSKHEGRS